MTSEYKKIGYEFTKGALSYIATFFIGVIIIIGLFILIGNFFNVNVDDSDFSSWNRSGLKIYTDYKTGVQYLGTKSGHLTPRITRDGEIVIINP